MIARFDYDVAQRVWRWPIREALVAFVERVREQAAEQYRHEVKVWAAIAPHSKKKTNAPELPAVLRPDGNS